MEKIERWRERERDGEMEIDGQRWREQWRELEKDVDQSSWSEGGSERRWRKEGGGSFIRVILSAGTAEEKEVRGRRGRR